MLKTIGFWLRYIISLRSALYKRGVVPRKDWRAIFGEEAFIDMIELMTELDVQKRSVHQYCLILHIVMTAVMVACVLYVN